MQAYELRFSLRFLPDIVAIHLLSTENSDRYDFFCVSRENQSDNFTVSGCNPADIPEITDPILT